MNSPTSLKSGCEAEGIPPEKEGKVPWLARAKSLAPLIEREAASAEAATTITPAVVLALRETGLWWMLAPQEFGGGCSVIELIEVTEELSRAHGSTGWTFMADGVSTGFAAAYCGARAAEVLFSSSNLAIVAGAHSPQGTTAVPVPGGFRGGGKYGFGSGCAHADWVAAGVTILENGKPRQLSNGEPELRSLLIPKSRLKILGNWNVMGMVATGSYDYEVPEQVVEEDFAPIIIGGKAKRGGPTFALGSTALACAGHTGVVLGLMKRALQEIAKIALSKKRLGYTGVVGEHPAFLHDFGMQEALYQAVRAYVISVYADALATVERGDVLNAEQSARFPQSTVWAHKVAADIVSFCHLWSGSAGIRNPSALGLCLRDVYTATQHIIADRTKLIGAAPRLLNKWKQSIE